LVQLKRAAQPVSVLFSDIGPQIFFTLLFEKVSFLVVPRSDLAFFFDKLPFLNVSFATPSGDFAIIAVGSLLIAFDFSLATRCASRAFWSANHAAHLFQDYRKADRERLSCTLLLCLEAAKSREMQ
jgi:hypothetical protein